MLKMLFISCKMQNYCNVTFLAITIVLHKYNIFKIDISLSPSIFFQYHLKVTHQKCSQFSTAKKVNSLEVLNWQPNSMAQIGTI